METQQHRGVVLGVEPQEGHQYLFSRSSIHGSDRLIRQNELRLPENRPCHGHPLLLSARQIVCSFVELIGDSKLVEYVECRAPVTLGQPQQLEQHAPQRLTSDLSE